MNDERLDAALDYLKDAVREHSRSGNQTSGTEYGKRRGAYKVLVALGFADAALDAIRQVYEDEGRRYPNRVAIGMEVEVTNG